jgi:hypothetical protein
LASTDSSPEIFTISMPCELGNHLRCLGRVHTLTLGLDAPVQVCECPVCAHDDEPAEEDGGLEDLLDLAGDLLLARELEDAHFAEGWS